MCKSARLYMADGGKNNPKPKQKWTWLHARATQWRDEKQFPFTTVESSHCPYQQQCMTWVQMTQTFLPLCLDAWIGCFNLHRQREENECLFISKLKSGQDFAMTYEYINVSGAKPKLYNLPPSMTKLKDLKEKMGKNPLVMLLPD